MKIKDFTTKLNKPSDDVVKFLKSLDGYDYKEKFLPEIFSFILSNCNREWMNILRRVILYRIPTKIMTFDIECPETDYSDFLSDEVLLKIKNLPINQDINYDDYEISLKYENKNEHIDVVNSSYFRFFNKKTKKVEDTDKFINTNFQLLSIEPTFHLFIPKLTVVILKENGAADVAGAFMAFPIGNYSVTGEKANLKITQSLESDYRNYYLQFTSHATMNTKDIVKTALDEIEKVANNTAKILKDAQEAEFKEDYQTENVIINFSADGLTTVEITGESFGFIRLLARYCYEEDKNISYVTSGVYEQNIAVIKLVHKKPLLLLVNCLKLIAKDCKVLSSQL